MTTQKFGQQIEHLLITGAIEGDAVCRLYHLLQGYQQGQVSAEVLQTIIDQHNPDYVEQWIDNNLPPLFDEPT